MLVGVVGGGNCNFVELFVYIVKDIVCDYYVLFLYFFEFSGIDEDVEIFKKVVEEIEFKRN